ncbi:hypothetical protein ACH5RR_025596 [Cinchona calisaya]|uniref:Uncharacterized protein n=1 Tax=Cinchona calisaya TaxID=153742 RepID=A0ABD2Z036_9GENT
MLSTLVPATIVEKAKVLKPATHVMTPEMIERQPTSTIVGSSHGYPNNKGLGNMAKGKAVMIESSRLDQTLDKGGVQQNSNGGLENQPYTISRLQGQMEFEAPKTWAARDRQSGFATFPPLRD